MRRPRITARARDILADVNAHFSHPVVYWACAAWIGIVIALAFLADPRVAILALAGSFVVLAVARLTLPTGYVPSVRSRITDAATLLLLAAALFFLARFALTPPVI